MLVSTKGRYALRMMLDLALHDTHQAVRIRDIAARQEISVKYLESIVAILAKAGFIGSTRGAQGGVRLSRAPETYTVGSILRVTEGSLAPVECLDEDRGGCSRKEGCTTVLFWDKLYDAIKGVADGYTLADLVQWAGAGADNYVI